MAIMFLIFPILLAALSLAQDNAASPTVTLASGVIFGTATSLPSATASVNKFLGVKYAVSPPERFSPPTPVQPFSEPYDATETKASCIQQFVCKLILALFCAR